MGLYISGGGIKTGGGLKVGFYGNSFQNFIKKVMQ